MGLFEFVIGRWIFWWHHNTNPGNQVPPIFLQADQPIRLQYSHQIKLLNVSDYNFIFKKRLPIGLLVIYNRS
jgi:hypothetical protein